MSSGYRAEVTIGAYSWTTTDADPKPVPGYVGVLVDPLVVSRYVPDGDLAPNIQQRAEASVTILAEAASTYSFGIGDAVAIVVYTQNVTGGNSVTFYGRVADVQAQPHKLGVLYTLTAQDYITDLAEPTVGKVDYPLETMAPRLARVMAEAGMGPFLYPAGYVDSIVDLRTAADEGPTSLLDYLQLVLNGAMAQDAHSETGAAVPNVVQTMLELAPNITGTTLDLVNPFKLVPIYARPLGYDPPGRLLPASPGSPRKIDVQTAQTSPATGVQVLDAGRVEFTPTWQLRKGDAITRITVQGRSLSSLWWATADWESGIPYYSSLKAPLETTVKTVLNASTMGEIIAAILKGGLPPAAQAAWRVGELLWRASRTEAADWVPPSLRQLLVVARIDAVNATSHSPTAKAYLYGSLATQRFTIAKGELQVAFTLAPPAAGFDTLNKLQHATLARYESTTVGTTTFAQVGTLDTWGDYLLLKDT